MRRADPSKDLLQRWKDEVGFPHGEIEDILNLSNPPWHTACPNPFLGAFVEASRQAPRSGRAVPPQAVRGRRQRGQDPSRLPGTRLSHQGATSGDCALHPPLHRARRPGSGRFRGHRHDRGGGAMVRDCAGEATGKNWKRCGPREGFGKPSWGLRRTIQNDLSPLAGFIAANYALPFDLDAFAEAGRVRCSTASRRNSAGCTRPCTPTARRRGRIDYTVWSEVFQLSRMRQASVVFVPTRPWTERPVVG